jgi:uncharacterized membrane protein YtjA (UPF0391 family)
MLLQKISSGRFDGAPIFCGICHLFAAVHCMKPLNEITVPCCGAQRAPIPRRTNRTVSHDQKTKHRAAGTFGRADIFLCEMQIMRCAARCGTYLNYEEAMLNLVVTLLIIALIAAVLGFGGIAGAAVGIAKIVFFVALVLFLVGAIAGGMRGPAL